MTEEAPFFDDEDEEKEDAEETADGIDVSCSKFGFDLDLKNDYIIDTGKNPFTKAGEPSKHFFKWYLKKCDQEKVELIKGTILKEDYQELWQDRLNEFIDEGNSERKKDEIVEQTPEVVEEREDPKKTIESLTQKLLIAQEEKLNYKILLQALYIFMNTKMDLKDGVEVSPEEEKLIIEVREVQKT